MAFLTLPDNMNDILYVKRSVRGKADYCGYKREYLAKNLTELEREMSLCKVCDGIIRKASLVSEEITCLPCSLTPNRLNAVKLVENCVNQLEIKCPLLRGCEWWGKLSEAETHLGECQHFLIKCRDCNQGVKRGGIDAHEMHICLKRIECEYCRKEGNIMDRTEHLLKYCGRYQIKCPNKCGKTISNRELLDHNANDCPLAEIDCPYAKYGCKANKMKRRDLFAHKKKYITEHVDMVETENRTLRAEIKTMKRLDGFRWEIKNVNELTQGQHVTSRSFYVNCYEVESICRMSRSGLGFTIQRIEGEHDQNLGVASITYYRIVILNKDGTTQSCYNGEINYQLKIGTISEEFTTSYRPYRLERIPLDSVTILLYFDVNSSYSQLQTCPIDAHTFPSRDDDPVDYEDDGPADYGDNESSD